MRPGEDPRLGSFGVGEVHTGKGLLQPMRPLVILFMALLVFGPKKLPELGKGLGDSIRGFKDGLRSRTKPTVTLGKLASEAMVHFLWLGVLLRGSVLFLVLLATVVLAATGYARGSAALPSSSSESQQTGKLLSVRKVLQNHYFVSRYPLIHYYLLYFEVRTSDQTYCAEYETPVLEEIDDLFAAKDKDVEIVLNGKNLTLRTPKGRKLKARLVDPKQC